MSEKDDKNVRRFGRRDRKDRLPKPDSLFPADDEIPESEDDPLAKAPVEFDMDSLNLPDTDSEALTILSTLRGEVRAPVIAPSAERYPPVAPVSEDKPAQTDPAPVKPSPAKSPDRLWHNFLTLIFVLATLANIAWFFAVWNDPQSTWNPFPPATPFVEMVVTPADNAMQFDATPDDSGQIFVVITDTPVPTVASTESPFPFITDPVLYAPNTNELGCNWWSVAGTVTDLDANPISGYRIRITGEDLNEAVFSGASQAFGEGGYELPLVGTPREAAFTVQLFSPQDAPLSDEVTVITRADCDSNVTILNFTQNR